MKDDALRDHLVALLEGGHAYMKVEEILGDFPASLASSRIEGMAHTPWQLMEHIRIAQWDILEFSRDAGHVSPKFPDGYWPDSETPPDDGAWGKSVEAFKRDLQSMVELVKDPATDLFAPIPHGSGQTVLREVLLVADHNAYHFGQLMVLRRALE